MSTDMSLVNYNNITVRSFIDAIGAAGIPPARDNLVSGRHAINFLYKWFYLLSMTN